MSLINDALKKAQRHRGDAPTSPTAPTSAPVPGPLSAAPSRNTAPASRPQLLLFGGGAALGLLLALGAVFLFRSPAPEPAATPVPNIAATATPPAPAENLTQPAAPTPTPAAGEPLSAPVTIAPAVREEALITVSTLPAAPATEPAKAAIAAREGAPPSPSLQMITAIEGFRIAGVRAAGTDSKVLMNDRVYRVGDVVDHVNGIRIAGVNVNSITFTDRSGATYTRNF